MRIFKLKDKSVQRATYAELYQQYNRNITVRKYKIVSLPAKNYRRYRKKKTIPTWD